MGHLFYILVVYLFDTKVERNEFREMIFKIFFPFFLSDHIEKKKKKKKMFIRCANIDLELKNPSAYRRTVTVNDDYQKFNMIISRGII